METLDLQMEGSMPAGGEGPEVRLSQKNQYFGWLGGFPKASTLSVPKTKLLNKINLPETQKCPLEADPYSEFYAHHGGTSLCDVAPWGEFLSGRGSSEM